jgi:hypothetical protein
VFWVLTAGLKACSTLWWSALFFSCKYCLFVLLLRSMFLSAAGCSLVDFDATEIPLRFVFLEFCDPLPMF